MEHIRAWLYRKRRVTKWIRRLWKVFMLFNEPGASGVRCADLGTGTITVLTAECQSFDCEISEGVNRMHAREKDEVVGVA